MHPEKGSGEKEEGDKKRQSCAAGLRLWKRVSFSLVNELVEDLNILTDHIRSLNNNSQELNYKISWGT